MNADAKAATLDLHLWSEGCGFAVERILKRKSPAYQRALSHQGEPSVAGPPDSHPSWRPPAMGVLSGIEG
jgi:hypothetical protein